MVKHTSKFYRNFEKNATIIIINILQTIIENCSYGVNIHLSFISPQSSFPQEAHWTCSYSLIMNIDEATDHFCLKRLQVDRNKNIYTLYHFKWSK